MILSLEQINILEGIEYKLKMAYYSDFIRDITANDISILQSILNDINYEGGNIKIKKGCGSCLIRYIKYVAKLYYNSKDYYNSEIIKKFDEKVEDPIQPVKKNKGGRPRKNK